MLRYRPDNKNLPNEDATTKHRGAMTAKDKTLVSGLYGPTGDPLLLTAGALTPPVQDGVQEGGEVYLLDPNKANGWHVDNFNTSLRMFRGASVYVSISSAGAVTINGRSADAVLNPARLHATRSAPQGSAHAAYTPLAFDSTQYIGSGYGSSIPMWSGSLPTRMVAPRTGVYAVGGFVNWAPQSAGTTRLLLVRVNGSPVVNISQTPPCGGGNYTALSASGDYLLNANDYVEVVGYQDSGSVVTITGAGWLRFVSE